MQNLGHSAIDEVNLRTYSQASTVEAYDQLSGWIDQGESVAFDHISRHATSQPILDIGVGTGRTTPLLRAISSDYVAIDYTQEMVEQCKKRFPDARVMQMDARDLSQFPSESFACVVFSFNGMDMVNYEDRAKIQAEIFRVLRPDGLFVFSAHNRNTPGFGAKPSLWVPKTRNPIKWARRTLKHLRVLPIECRNYQRNLPLHIVYPEWACVTCKAHDFSIITMYTTLGEQRRQLVQAGFELESAISCLDGKELAPTATNEYEAWWIYYVAKKNR